MTAKRIGRPPREIPRIKVSVRFEPLELAEIDAARGSVTRQEWLYGAGLGLARKVNG